MCGDFKKRASTVSLNAHVCMPVFCIWGFTKLVNTVNKLSHCHKMMIACVKVIIRENILTQISLNGPMLFNIKKLTNAELQLLKTIGILDKA